MDRHIISHPIVLLIVLAVCAGAVGNSAPPGTPRPSYPSGFSPGTRVVLLAEYPIAAPGMAPGRAGTVICCDATDCSESILVSWDLWAGGENDQGPCVTPPVGPYPPGSTVWIDPATTRLGRLFDKMGILREITKGCLHLETEDGRLYRLVIGPEFREQWWFVLPGNRVRIRGLLHTSAAETDLEQGCSPQDGSIYHPIMTASDWIGESCCDRWVCAFRYGDRVVLIGEDNPNGAVGLPRGASGTIICCNLSQDNAVLVSWNFWTHGGSDEAILLCTEQMAGIFPPGSTWWVALEDLGRYIRSECGELQTIELCSGDTQTELLGLFVPLRGYYFLPDLPADEPLPAGRFLASGLYAPYVRLPEGLAAIPMPDTQTPLADLILHPVLLPCHEPSCCEPAYEAGDRVRLLVNEPGGAPNLFFDATGTVICCNSSEPIAPILVEWDFWTGGHHDEHDLCDCCEAIAWYQENSAWWVACSEIEPILLPDLYDLGETHRAFTPPSLVAGEPGQNLSIQGLIGNRGGRPSGSFLVELYLSEDREITREDHFLGNVGMSIDVRGLAALSWAGTFPTDIPPGAYFVGWLIDPDNRIKEADETNNMAVIEAGQLIVTDE